MPRIEDIQIDVHILAFTLIVSLGTGIVFSLAPAIQSSGVDLNSALKINTRGSDNKGHRQVRQALIVGQIALTFVLLITAGLMIRSFWRLQQVELGFVPDNLLTVRVSVPPKKYKYGPPLVNFYNRVEEKLGSLPGVRSVGASTFVLLNQVEKVPFLVENREPESQVNVDLPINGVSPTYFEAMMIPIIKGRGFSVRDMEEDSNVVIVNETMASRYWPSEDPIGKRFKFNDPSFPSPWFTVIAVVRNAHRYGPEKPVEIEAYLPVYNHSMDLVIRTQRSASSIAGLIHDEVKALDQEVVIREVRTIDEQLDQLIEQRRFTMLVLGIFAGAALLLAVVGVYGVMSYIVAQRTQEIGIRIALGARTRDIKWMVMGQGLRLAVIGLIVGLMGSVALTRFVGSLLFGISASDPITFVFTSLLFLAAVLMACLVPLRTAQRISPLLAIRHE
ncbi:MAG: FtsX-like permease family protein [Pyrinomonadaceae bacterium]